MSERLSYPNAYPNQTATRSFRGDPNLERPILGCVLGPRLGCAEFEEDFGVSDSAEQVVRQFLAALKRSDVDELVGFFSDDAVWTDGPRGTYRGVNAIRAEIESQVQLVPSLTVEVENLVATGGTVMVERADTFETQGKSFDLEVVGVFEIDGSGLIKRLRDYYDLQSLMDRVAAAFA
jgi:limonene-1,2-epoxide hydrolase